MIRSVADTLSEADRADPAKVDLRLRQAYMAFAAGRAGMEDAEIILVDLAKVTGYHMASAEDVSPNTLLFREGARSVYAHISAMINTTPDRHRMLEQAMLRAEEAGEV